ncbi:Uncharacterised protein [Mycobacterium tuberculosis]|nr:Uncharacterised protein [Mycobacterium tuberculosis]
MEPLRIRRRDVWRAERRGWRGRLRSSGVLLPLALGLAMLAGGFYWYWDSEAFARRSVVTEAVVESVEPPYRIEREDGSPTFVSYGRVRYRAASRTVTTRVKLGTCRRTPCVATVAPGARLTVAYDPEAVRRARRAPPGGLSAAPNPAMLLLGGMGVLLVVVAAYTLLSYSPSSR